jgi:hypothetical protein
VGSNGNGSRLTTWPVFSDLLEEGMKKTPVTQTIEKSILDIQILASDLDQTNTDKLNSDLWKLESKASALRSFILNRVIRTA